MSDYKALDSSADVLPVGLQPTPFGEVWQALQQVAASVWSVAPSVYRAGMAWLWYAINHPDDLASDNLRALLVAALISEQAPMVKDWQTNAELVEYLRLWREYTPTYDKLEAIFALFGVTAQILPISDAESQLVMPVADRRLSFYIRIEAFDSARPLTLAEISQIATRATPLGSRPYPYLALMGETMPALVGSGFAGSNAVYLSDTPAEMPDPGPTPPAYTEITLYMQSGTKLPQTSVTSSFTGNVISDYCYQLYTDEECTTPWTGYDYSNDYVLGYYRAADGAWVERIDAVSEMPDTTTPTTGDSKFGYVLLDVGKLWICSNYTLSGTYRVGTSKIVVRIYPKGQQVFALYSNSSSVYDNTTINFHNYSRLFLKPGLSGDIYPGNWPSKSLIKVLGSAGNVVSEGYNDFNFTTANGMLVLINAYGSAVAKSVRCALFTFSEPVYYAELASDTYVYSSANKNGCRLYEKYPTKLNFEEGYSYKVIIPIALNGSATGGVQSAIDALYFAAYSSSDQNAILRSTSSSGFYLKALWYTKTPKPIEVNFGDPVTIPAGYTVGSVMCSRGYAFASNVSSESSMMGQFVNYEFLGEKVYFDDTNTSLVGVGVVPALQIFAITNLQQQGYYLSTKSGSTQNYLSTAAASELNSNSYFVKGTTNYNDSNIMNTIVNALQTYFPVYFNLSDSSGNWLYFCFRVPQTLWQVQNGVFSWLGDTTNITDLAYWYNGRAVQINLVPIS